MSRIDFEGLLAVEDGLLQVVGTLPDYSRIRGSVLIDRQANKEAMGGDVVNVWEVYLPHGAEVVAYCRGPYCVYADEAVRELARRGFKARRLVDGYPEWKRAGLPVAAGKGG